MLGKGVGAAFTAIEQSTLEPHITFGFIRILATGFLALEFACVRFFWAPHIWLALSVRVATLSKGNVEWSFCFPFAVSIFPLLGIFPRSTLLFNRLNRVSETHQLCALKSLLSF